MQTSLRGNKLTAVCSTHKLEATSVANVSGCVRLVVLGGHGRSTRSVQSETALFGQRIYARTHMTPLEN